MKESNEKLKNVRMSPNAKAHRRERPGASESSTTVARSRSVQRLVRRCGEKTKSFLNLLQETRAHGGVRYRPRIRTLSKLLRLLEQSPDCVRVLERAMRPSPKSLLVQWQKAGRPETGALEASEYFQLRNPICP